jgi:neutral ceramidase
MRIGNLKAGVGQAQIGCQTGVLLAGHHAGGAPRAATIASPLMARALVLDDGKTQLTIVALDAAGIPGAATQRALAELGERFGWAPEQVMFVCSGAASTPRTVPCLGGADTEASSTAAIVQAAIDAAGQARASLQDAALGAGQAILPRLPFNRRLLTRNLKVITEWTGVPENEVLAPEGPVDPALDVFLVRDGRGFPLAVLWSFAADARFPQADAISAGLAYQVQQELNDRLGRPVTSLYLPGCSGNVDFNFELARSARELASAITAVVLETPCDPDVSLGARREEVVLPIKDYSRFWDEAEIEAKWPVGLQAYRQEVELLQAAGEQAVPTWLQAMRLGNLGLVGLPGQPFVELGLQVKQQSPFRATIVASNAGDAIGYILPEEALRNGGQEAWVARFAKVGRGAGEFLAQEALDLLHELA